MHYFTTAATALLAVTTVAAQSATVVIEASHGGAGNDLTNTTITVPLNSLYTDAALQTVSSLFLTNATGVALQSVTCTPYRYANGTGDAGLAFTARTPSLLSTNTVMVGSLYCGSAASNSTSPVTTGSSSTATSIVSSGSNYTSFNTSRTSAPTNLATTMVVTVPASSTRETNPATTVTSFATGDGNGMSTTTTSAAKSPSNSASASASLGSGGDGLKMRMRDWTAVMASIIATGVFAMLL